MGKQPLELAERLQGTFQSLEALVLSSSEGNQSFVSKSREAGAEISGRKAAAWGLERVPRRCEKGGEALQPKFNSKALKLGTCVPVLRNTLQLEDTSCVFPHLKGTDVLEVACI